jgi:hypothetical protein
MNMSIARCIERRLAIEIDLSPTRDVIYSGVCIKQNRHVLILVNYNEETQGFDGYTILRTREVSRYRRWDSNENAKANRDTLHAYLGILPLEKMNTMYTCIREASRMGLIALFTGNDDSSYYEAYLTSIDREIARFRLLRPPKQRSRYLKMQLDDINYVAFDTSYERELNKKYT